MSVFNLKGSKNAFRGDGVEPYESRNFTLNPRIVIAHITHCAIHEEQGQFQTQEIQTEIRPGKEYMFFISAEGEWSMTFSEGC